MTRDRRYYLKVKIKSLAAEARIIRDMERAVAWRRPAPGLPLERRRRYEGWVGGLADHRKRVVAREQRSALLAYGFLRGRGYGVLEQSARTAPDLDRVEALVRKFGVVGWNGDYQRVEHSDGLKAAQEAQAARFAEWRKDAEAWAKGRRS